MRRRRAVAVALASTCLLGALPAGIAAAQSARPGQERPPECKTVPYAVGSATYRATFCGMGSGAEFPLRPLVRSLILETQGHHLYFFWPGSWQS